MTARFSLSLMAVTLIATLGIVPALAQRAGGNGPGFHGGFVGPHPGFVAPNRGFGRGFVGPRFGRGFVGPRPGFRRDFAQPHVVVRPSFPAGYVGSRS